MRILHQNIGAIALALVIVIMLDPTARAEDNIARSGTATSAAAQPGHSPANAPNEVNEMPTSPPVGAPAVALRSCRRTCRRGACSCMLIE
jgi:hypothetical protein